MFFHYPFVLFMCYCGYLIQLNSRKHYIFLTDKQLSPTNSFFTDCPCAGMVTGCMYLKSCPELHFHSCFSDASGHVICCEVCASCFFKCLDAVTFMVDRSTLKQKRAKIYSYSCDYSGRAIACVCAKYFEN